MKLKPGAQSNRSAPSNSTAVNPRNVVWVLDDGKISPKSIDKLDLTLLLVLQNLLNQMIEFAVTAFSTWDSE